MQQLLTASGKICTNTTMHILLFEMTKTVKYVALSKHGTYYYVPQSGFVYWWAILSYGFSSGNSHHTPVFKISPEQVYQYNILIISKIWFYQIQYKNYMYYY